MCERNHNRNKLSTQPITELSRPGQVASVNAPNILKLKDFICKTRKHSSRMHAYRPLANYHT